MEGGARVHTREQILSAIASASVQMRAMIYLGINCAFLPVDCCRLTWGYLDLDGGWHCFNREKSWTPRRAALWPETVAALNAVPRTGDLVFRTKYKNPWTNHAVSQESKKLKITFSWLRKTFRTVADETGHTQACRLVMGHTSPASDMDATYVRCVSDEVLLRVAEHVRSWLLPAPSSPAAVDGEG